MTVTGGPDQFCWFLVALLLLHQENGQNSCALHLHVGSHPAGCPEAGNGNRRICNGSTPRQVGELSHDGAPHQRAARSWGWRAVARDVFSAAVFVGSGGCSCPQGFRISVNPVPSFSAFWTSRTVDVGSAGIGLFMSLIKLVQGTRLIPVAPGGCPLFPHGVELQREHGDSVKDGQARGLESRWEAQASEQRLMWGEMRASPTSVII